MVFVAVGGLNDIEVCVILEPVDKGGDKMDGGAELRDVAVRGGGRFGFVELKFCVGGLWAREKEGLELGCAEL